MVSDCCVELSDSDRSAAAIATLERMQGRQWPRLEGWGSGDFSYLFRPAFEISQPAFMFLQEQLLDDYGRYLLCENFRAAGLFAGAIEVASAIADERSRSVAIGNIAIAQADAGDSAAAVQTAHGVDDEGVHAVVLATMSVAQAQVDREAAQAMLDTACESSKRIGDEEKREEALSRIAQAQAGLGDFSAARETMQRVKDAQLGVEMLIGIGMAQSEGDPEAARATIASAFSAARQLVDGSEKVKALKLVVQSQARVQEFAAALATAQIIRETLRMIEEQDEGEWVAALETIALALVEAEQPTAMLEEVLGPDDQLPRMKVSIAIAEGKAKAGDFRAAVEVAQRMNQAWARADAFCKIGAHQVRIDPEQARETLTQAYHAAQTVKNREERVMLLGAIAAAQSNAGYATIARSRLPRYLRWNASSR